MRDWATRLGISKTGDEKSEELRRFLVRMGRGSRQGAVGFVIDRHYLEIPFPLEESRDGEGH